MVRGVRPTPGSSRGYESQPRVREELWLRGAANQSDSAGPQNLTSSWWQFLLCEYEMLPLSPLLSRFPELCPFVSFGFEQAQDARAPKPTAGSGSSSFCRVHGRSHASESAEVKQFISHLEQRLIMELNPAEALEANRRLEEDLNRAERKAARLEMEVTLLKKNMGRKTTALQTTREELRQARQQMEQSQALYMQADQERKDAVQRAEELRERVAQLQGENLWLRQQLGDAQNKAAPEPVREMGQPEETSVAAGTQQHDGLERENPHVPEDLDKVKAKAPLSVGLDLLGIRPGCLLLLCRMQMTSRVPRPGQHRPTSTVWKRNC
ncbi:hypothetical protein Q9966_010538 [Columba livia]|nr:hypothetical protein Q9966_010538 [Columba livia]